MPSSSIHIVALRKTPSRWSERRSGRPGTRCGCRRARGGPCRCGPSRTASRTAPSRSCRTRTRRRPSRSRRPRSPAQPLGLLAALDLDAACRPRASSWIGSFTWPWRPMPSMTPSTTAVPCVKSSTAAKATSAQSGTGPIIWPRFLIGVTSSEGRPSIETVKSVPSGVVTRTLRLPLQRGHRVASLAASRALNVVHA